jgi:hypothetical protein
MSDEWRVHGWDKGKWRATAHHENRCRRCHEIISFYEDNHGVEACVTTITEREEKLHGKHTYGRTDQ